MAPRPCPTCKGARLKPEVLAVTIAGRNIREIVNYSVLQARDFFAALEERVPAGLSLQKLRPATAARGEDERAATAAEPYAVDERNLTPQRPQNFAIARQIPEGVASPACAFWSTSGSTI